MKTLLILLTSFLFLHQTATAQLNNEKTLLWKVTGKGIKPSYVFGTIHIIQKDNFFWTEEMDKSLKKCQQLVMEVDMSKLFETSIIMMKMAPMDGDSALSDLLPEEDYLTIKNFFEKESKSAEVKMTPFSMIENWKPMLLQSFLVSEMIEGPVKMYEQEIMVKAKSNKMTFGGLETVEDQMKALDYTSYSQQAKDLLELVQSIKEGSGSVLEFQTMIELYKQQDIDGLYTYIEKETGGSGGVMQTALLDKRNKAWIPKIKEMSSKNKVFYAVGAGHLSGESGVLNLLRKEGYKVIPIR